MEKNKDRKTGGLNRDVFVFTFFFLLSFALWFLNKLDKEVEAEIRMPYEMINVPRGRTLGGDMPERINVTLKGTGYTILKVKYPGKKTPVKFDLSKVVYKRVPEGRVSDYYIVTAGLLKSINSQLRSGCDVISVKPDTIYFSLSRAETSSTSK